MGGAASQHENELVLDVLRLSEPAFAVNGAHQIVAWNDGAERLLGLRADEVMGMNCYEALAIYEGVFCGDCSARCGIAAHLAGAHPRTLLPARRHTRSRVSVTTIAAHTRTGQLRVVHLLRDTRGSREAETVSDGAAIAGGMATPVAPPDMPAARFAIPLRRLPSTTVAPTPCGSPLADPAESGSKQRRSASLTQRELEVLRLLGAGHSTDDIARELSITRVTARNHVNKVLDKLGVNSRLQAVVIASQLQLI